MLTPMVAVGSRHFYVFEFARLVTGEYVVPERWVKYKSEMHGEVFRVSFDGNGIASIDDSATVRVKVADLRDTFLDLSKRGEVPRCNGELFNLTRETIQINHHPRHVNRKICKCDAQP
jgi:hypothetical protein